MTSVLPPISPKFTKDVLIEILKRQNGCEEIVITEIETGGASKKGDSYLSTIYKFSVKAIGKKDNGQEQDIFLPIIAKSIPKNVARRKTFLSFDFFETEISFYKNVWPLMKKLKDSKNLNERDEVPLMLSSFCDGKDDYIALLDVSYDGYDTVPRDKGINQEYASLFLKLLAHFHALSIATREQDPDFEKAALSLKETYFHERYRNWYGGFLNNKLYYILKHAAEKELAPHYFEKIDKLFKTDYYGILCDLARVRNKFSVVTEGDAWIPNFLVKLEGGKPADAILIDFQLARYSTVTNDLLHFLYCCISPEVLLNQWDDLLQDYYNCLSQRIYELGCDKTLITLEELKEDIQKNSLLGLAMAMESIVMSNLEDHEVAELDMLQGDEAVPLETVWDISPFQDEIRNKKVAFLIKHAVDKGLIK